MGRNYRFYSTASFLLRPACRIDPGICGLNSVAPTTNPKAGRDRTGTGTCLIDSRSPGVNGLCSIELVQPHALFGCAALDPSSDWCGCAGPDGADSSPAVGTKSFPDPLCVDWVISCNPASFAGGLSAFPGSLLFLGRNLRWIPFSNLATS